jgi:peptide/nickel transport system permease protein
MATVTARAPARVEVEPEVEIGRLRSLWATMCRKPLGAASAALILALVLTAILADAIAPYDPLAAQPEIRLAAPSWAHPFGTDDIGRDVLSRVIHGAGSRSGSACSRWASARWRAWPSAWCAATARAGPT